MLTFFTDPYEDELLYSAIARYHYYYGNIDYKDTLYEVFGSKSVIPSIAFPSRLDFLSEQLPNNKLYSSEHFIYKHSLYPFYAPFLEAEKQKKIVEHMKSDNGKRIFTQIGAAAGGVCPKEGLYYCPVCVNEDIQKVGEPYFHRIHQLQGVFLCPEHGCRTEQYPVSKKDISRIAFIRLEKQLVNLTLKYEENERLESAFIRIAKAAMYMLQTDLKHINYSFVNQRYKKLLAYKGFTTCNGAIKQEKFAKEFTNYFGIETLEKLESSISDEDESSWIRILLRKSNRTVHPIRHILLILFLCESIDVFFEKPTVSEYQPFGDSPWPCLNPTVDHYKMNVVENCIITPDYKTRQPIGTFTCSCGFVYSRKGPDQILEDRYRIGRIKEFGKMWENKFSELLCKGNCSIRGFGRIMKCDPKTVVKQAQRLGLDKYLTSNMTFKFGNNLPYGEQNSEVIRENYAAEIIELVDKEPGITRTQVRKGLKKQYSWFYKNDKQWLHTNLPSVISQNKRRNSNSDTRVDWKARDKAIVQEIEGVYNELLSQNKPVRITKSLLGKKIGKAALLGKYSNKLPETIKYINSISETIDDFQIRRINKICEQMYISGSSFKKWKIEKLSGLRPGYSEKVSDCITKNIEKYDMRSFERQ